MSRAAVILLWLSLALPLSIMGAAASWAVASPAWDALEARGWVKARAYVQWVDVQWPSDNRARVMGGYRYEIGDKQYESDDLAFASAGAGQLDWWPIDMYDYLRLARDERRPIMIWVDPSQPARAVVDRELGTGTLLLMLPMALVLDILAFKALAAAFRASRAPEGEEMEIIELKSGETRKRDFEHLKIMWFIAVVWNMLAWLTAIEVIQTVAGAGRWYGYLSVLAPLVGIWALWRCVVHTWRNWDEVKRGSLN